MQTLIKMSTITASAILAASKTMSKDETRIFLCGVCVKNEGQNLVVQATDGYSAIKKVVRDGRIDFFDDKESILSKVFIDRLGLALKQSKKEKKPFVEALMTSDCLIFRDYPKTEVFFNTKADHFKVSFNIEFLKRALDSFEFNSKREEYVTFNFTNDALKPVVLTNNYLACESQIGIIMPRKI